MYDNYNLDSNQLQLSKNFLLEEYSLGQKACNMLARDPFLKQCFFEWERLSDKFRKDFLTHVTKKLNDNYFSSKSNYPDIVFEYFKDDRLFGIYDKKNNKIIVSDNVSGIINPIGYISNLVHEHLGHARQYRKEFSNNLSMTPQDRYLINNNLAKYTYPKENILGYVRQPIEVHADIIMQGYLDEVKHDVIYPLYEHYQQKYKQKYPDDPPGNIIEQIVDFTKQGFAKYR